MSTKLTPPLFTEDLPPYGTLSCVRLYGWYDGAKIYVLENEQHRLFVYWAGDDQQGSTFWYLPISAATQQAIDQQELCLHTVLSKHKGEAITFKQKEIVKRCTISPGRDKQSLPDKGILLDREDEALLV